MVLAVGRQSRTVTVGQVVNNKGTNDWRASTGSILRLDVGHVGVHGGNLGCAVTTVCQKTSVTWIACSDLQPDVCANFGDGASLGLQTGRQRRDGQGVDLRGIVRVGVDLLAKEDVA